MALHRSISLLSSHPQTPYFTGDGGISSFILRFPPNFVRQLSIKTRRNCNNFGVAQFIVANWSNDPGSALSFVPAAASVDEEVLVAESVKEIVSVESKDVTHMKPSFLKSDGSLTVHAGERLGRGIVTDAITTPVVNTSLPLSSKRKDLFVMNMVVMGTRRRWYLRRR